MGQPLTQEYRNELIVFIIRSVAEIEGHTMTLKEVAHLHCLSDEKLRKEADWYDYLLDK